MVVFDFSPKISTRINLQRSYSIPHYPPNQPFQLAFFSPLSRKIRAENKAYSILFGGFRSETEVKTGRNSDSQRDGNDATPPKSKNSSNSHPSPIASLPLIQIVAGDASRPTTDDYAHLALFQDANNAHLLGMDGSGNLSFDPCGHLSPEKEKVLIY